MEILVYGTGLMGKGISLVFAKKGHSVLLYNPKLNSSKKAYSAIESNLIKLVSKNRLSEIEKLEFNKIHLLTHPFWYNHRNETTKEKLLKFVNQSRKERYEQINQNFRNVGEFLKMDEIK